MNTNETQRENRGMQNEHDNCERDKSEKDIKKDKIDDVHSKHHQIMICFYYARWYYYKLFKISLFVCPIMRSWGWVFDFFLDRIMCLFCLVHVVDNKLDVFCSACERKRHFDLFALSYLIIVRVIHCDVMWCDVMLQWIVNNILQRNPCV